MKNQQQDQEPQSKSLEEFLEELKVSGRYFIGNPTRIDYLKRHGAQLNAYLDSLKISSSPEDRREAKLIADLVKLNSKEGRRPDSLAGLLERGTTPPNLRREPRNSITRYSSRPRKRVEIYVYSAILLTAMSLAWYTGIKFKQQIEKFVPGYVLKLYQLYDELDHKK